MAENISPLNTNRATPKKVENKIPGQSLKLPKKLWDPSIRVLFTLPGHFGKNSESNGNTRHKTATEKSKSRKEAEKGTRDALTASHRREAAVTALPEGNHALPEGAGQHWIPAWTQISAFWWHSPAILAVKDHHNLLSWPMVRKAKRC